MSLLHKQTIVPSSFRRTFSSLLAVSVVLLLGLSACAEGEAVPVTRIASAVPPLEPEQPEPVPTAPPSVESLRLAIGGGNLLSGQPPYMAHLTASFDAYRSGLPTACSQLTWVFGDGTEVNEPCQIETTEVPYPTFQVKHRYEQAGIYHARARLELADGRVVESEKAQTIIVATPQPASLRTTIIRWTAWVALLTGIGLILIWLIYQRAPRRRWGAGLLALFLITFVPPFSYVPDPLGAILSVTGGYRYDPRLPLVNRFLIAGDPTEALRPTLDGLIGQTGLDPLDPASPLARYDFVQVVQQPYHVAVHVRFTYADGRERTYAVPLRQPTDHLNFYACCWRYDGLGRLRTAHRALPPVPFAEASAPVLGTPQRLPLPVVDAGNPQNWFHAGSNPLNRRLLWSPQGDAFLTVATTENTTDLWRLSVEDGRARKVASNVWEYAWLADGTGILFSTVEQGERQGISKPVRQIHLLRRDGNEPQQVLELPMGRSTFPAVTEAGLWYAQDSELWLLALDGDKVAAEPQRLATLAGTVENTQGYRPIQISPAPDGGRVAYTCGPALCMIDRDGSNHTVAVSDTRFVSLAWRPDGQQLAAVFWEYGGGDGRPATLRLIDRDGSVRDEIKIASDGPVDAAQWRAEGESLFLQTYPHDGRRILLVNTGRGEAIDLSQPRWDAFFALHPDGDRLLLSNGRGGFWLAPVQPARSPASSYSAAASSAKMRSASRN